MQYYKQSYANYMKIIVASNAHKEKWFYDRQTYSAARCWNVAITESGEFSFTRYRYFHFCMQRESFWIESEQSKLCGPFIAFYMIFKLLSEHICLCVRSNNICISGINISLWYIEVKNIMILNLSVNYFLR